MSTIWEPEPVEVDVVEVDVAEAEGQLLLKRDEAISLTMKQLKTIGEGKVNQYYKVKASLVLVGSDVNEWGIIEDTLSDLAWEPGKGEIVGTWARTKYDRLIYVSLCTSIQALQDRAVQTFAEYAERRRQQTTPKKTRTPKTVKGEKAGEKAEEQAPVTELPFEERMKFNDLRARLGRAK